MRPGVLDDDAVAAHQGRGGARVEDAIDFAKSSPLPDPATATDLRVRLRSSTMSITDTATMPAPARRAAG